MQLGHLVCRCLTVPTGVWLTKGEAPRQGDATDLREAMKKNFSKVTLIPYPDLRLETTAHIRIWHLQGPANKRVTAKNAGL